VKTGGFAPGAGAKWAWESAFSGVSATVRTHENEFFQPFYTKTDRVTKTGSGQTQGKLEPKNTVWLVTQGNDNQEIHLQAGIAMAIRSYFRATNDLSFLRETGACESLQLLQLSSLSPFLLKTESCLPRQARDKHTS